MSPSRLTPNQIVAWNLHVAREWRGWTQEEAADRLAPYLGEHWSKASYSSAERSFDGVRIRQFTADDIYAFARAFDLPMSLFLTPPPWVEEEIGHAGGGETSTRHEYFDSIFDMPEDARRYFREKVLEFSGPATRMLRKWGANFAEMIAERERSVAASGFEIREEN